MIYLDYAATTPICEEALTVYQKLSMDMYGNASSLHDAGGKAKHILEYAVKKSPTSLAEKQAASILQAAALNPIFWPFNHC